MECRNQGPAGRGAPLIFILPIPWHYYTTTLELTVLSHGKLKEN